MMTQRVLRPQTRFTARKKASMAIMTASLITQYGPASEDEWDWALGYPPSFLNPKRKR